MTYRFSHCCLDSSCLKSQTGVWVSGDLGSYTWVAKVPQLTLNAFGSFLKPDNLRIVGLRGSGTVRFLGQ
jgi:hypothetical protein